LPALEILRISLACPSSISSFFFSSAAAIYYVANKPDYIETLKGGSCDLKFLWAATSHKYDERDVKCNSLQTQHFRNFGWIRRPNFLSKTDRPVFTNYFKCACSETATSELPVKLLHRTYGQQNT